MNGSKIKVCIILPNLKCGGSERFISIICNHINTENFDIELYVLDGSDPFYKITNPGIRSFFLSVKNVRRSLPTILKITKRTKPDIMFTASNHLNVFLSIFKFLFPKKIKFVARESSIVSINNKTSKYGRIYEWLVKNFYKNIDHIICQSVAMQNDLVTHYRIKKEKTIIIPNPVEPLVVPVSGHKEKTAYKFFTVGRLSCEKGIDRLLNSLAKVAVDFTFHIIGDGPEKSNLQKLTTTLNLQNKVFFEGQKLNPYENMSNADLFLIGSHYEGFPNVLLEAGILGIPVVGFNSPGGINEIIRDNKKGF